MKTRFAFFITIISLSFLTLNSCKKDTVEPNEEEVITTLIATFTDNATSAKTTFKFDDTDGPGGTAPTTDMITLAPGKSYTVALTLLNKTANPVDTLSNEIDEEADDHEFFFEPTAGSNITVTNRNLAGSLNLPLGLSSTWTTGAIATSSIRITLKHKPGTKAAGDVVTKGETDIEVVFPTKIQ
jgi:hypothetical protein